MTTPYELRPPNEPRRPQEPTHGRRFAVSVTLLYAITVLSLAALLGLRMHDWARQRIVQSSILATIGTPIVSAADAVATEMAAPDLSGSAASQPQAAAPVVTPEPTPSFINILLLGSDERPDETGPSRTDTMILLSINPQEKTLGMLSMPRDLWVPIPGQNITTKINTAYGIGEAQAYAGGGAQLAKDTVSSLIGRPVDYFVRVNFDGFRELIDLIGGVDVVVASTIHDEEYPTADYGVETFHLDAGAAASRRRNRPQICAHASHRRRLQPRPPSAGDHSRRGGQSAQRQHDPPTAAARAAVADDDAEQHRD
jgi:LCP family protein required for cell wall assembly